MIEIQNEYASALGDYTFIDLFCGIGGFHLSLSAFGAHCVFASEIDSEAKRVYENNFNVKTAGDIKLIKEEEIPKHDILCGGFPCQPFSISGKGKGFADKERGKLFFEIIRVVKYHKPKIILLENVPTLETHSNGNTIFHMFNALKKHGYTPFKAKLNAADFGVPQVRKRLYIVAFRADLDIKEFKFPNPITLQRKLKDILIEDENTTQFEIKRNYKLIKNYKEKELNCNEPYIRIGEIGLGRQGERIYSINGCATTLSSTSGGLGGRTGMYLINNSVRKLMPRECARLMGFPDCFEMACTVNQSYKQFGNSVVVDVLQQILMEIIKQHMIRR